MTIQPYLAEFWPSGAGRMHALVGDFHVACLRASGNATAWGETLLLWATHVAGGRIQFREGDRAVVRLGGSWLVLSEGTNLSLGLTETRQLRGTELTLHYDAFSFDLYGRSVQTKSEVATAFSSLNPVRAGDLCAMLDVPWYEDRAPLVDIEFVASEETAELLQTGDELVAVAAMRFDLGPDVASALGADYSLT